MARSDVLVGITEPEILESYEIEILKLAVGTPTREKMTELLRQYESPRFSLIVARRSGTKTVGIAGLEQVGDRDMRIRHIAVEPDSQQQGIGRALVEAAVDLFEPRVMRAETHDGAVPFYRSVGFEVESLGEKYPGIERFECTLHV